MKIAGIISEYNPFHNGHAYQIEQIRKRGATHVVAAMSGHFVQRGDLAICSKWTRTKSALLCGVDLVLEIPVSFSLSSAKRFAYGGVSILNAAGCVNILSFGSEAEHLSLLLKAFEAVNSSRVLKRLSFYLNQGVTFAAAREKAVADIYGEEIAQILHRPNNTLAVEYIQALHTLSSSIQPMNIQRTVEHDSLISQNNDKSVCSASQIREFLKHKRLDKTENYMPKSSYDLILKEREKFLCPSNINELENTILIKIREMEPSDIKELPDISEGLENRIYDCARRAVSLHELLDSIKTKRYTYARIRRIALYALLGMKKKDLCPSPPYIRVLGFNERGRDILRKMRKTAKLPIVMRSADIRSLSDEAKQTFAQECIAMDIYALSTPRKRPCGLEMTENTIRIL